MSDPAAIETSRATIRTSVVSISVVKIDNRQMTMAVFRQLPQVFWMSSIDATPWGWVNYWPEGVSLNLYRPIILEKGGRLARALLPRTESWNMAAWIEGCIEADAGEIRDVHQRREESARLRPVWEERGRQNLDALSRLNRLVDDLGQLFIAT